MASSGTYLNLTLPNVGSTLGPTWATTLNDAFIDLDDHDHSTQGKSIPTAGISINADLEFNNYNLTEVKSVVLQSQATNLTTSGNLFNRNNELFFYNGTAVAQITQNGAVLGGMSQFSYEISTSSTTITLTATSGAFFFLNGTAATINLPDASEVDGGHFFLIKNNASGTIAVTPYGTQTIDGGTGGTAVSISTAWGHAWFVSDGTSKWLRVQN